MRELLIRYLLGELEPHEHDAVHRQLAESPELRRELARLRLCIAASDSFEDEFDAPPSGLAERTAGLVSDSGSHGVLPKRPAFKDDVDPPAGALGWSLADLTVAGGVILAVSMLLFPALRDSRNSTRRVVCQQHQQEIGNLVLLFAENNGGIIPPVHPGEYAGTFAMQLAALNYTTPEHLSTLLVCPGAPEADLIRNREATIRIPMARELRTMNATDLHRTVAWISPMYAYRFGFLEEGRKYHYVTVRGPRTPILSDAPSGIAYDMSPNHCGAIVQVLYSDGSVDIMTHSDLEDGSDDLFRNRDGQVDAGIGSNDFVLGRSEARPRMFYVKPVGSPPTVPMYWQQLEPKRELFDR